MLRVSVAFLVQEERSLRITTEKKTCSSERAEDEAKKASFLRQSFFFDESVTSRIEADAWRSDVIPRKRTA